MRFGVNKRVHYDSGPNMTPMVDVVMVLLVFLMLAGSFAGSEHYLVSNQVFNPRGGGGQAPPPGFVPDQPLEVKIDSPAPGRFDPDKLMWVNHEHIKRLPADELGRRLRPFLERAGLDVAAGPAPASVAELFRDRTATLAEMSDAAHYFYAEPTHANILARFADLMTAAVRSALPELVTAFETVDWNREAIGASIKSVAAKCGVKTAQLMMAARAVVTGEAQTPPIDAVLALVGRERAIDRLRRGLAG
jgi:glutamyl/glutaminyl-tRNA synthetase